MPESEGVWIAQSEGHSNVFAFSTLDRCKQWLVEEQADGQTITMFVTNGGTLDESHTFEWSDKRYDVPVEWVVVYVKIIK